MFRPEWTRMLHVADGEDADEPAIEWNDSHLLHRFTYFVGEVDNYYEWRGRRSCAAARTGDSVWALPFAEESQWYDPGMPVHSGGVAGGSGGAGAHVDD